MYDFLIKNGTIIDGTGAPSFIGDIVIKDGILHLTPKISKQMK